MTHRRGLLQVAVILSNRIPAWSRDVKKQSVMKFCYLLCSKAGTELPLNIKKTANKVQYFTTNVLLKFNRRRKDRKESFQKF